MTEPAKIYELPIPKPNGFLGPGHVVDVFPHAVDVEIRGGERVRAQMATSVPYAPALDDVLLVIGAGDEHYVIGVLRGTGKTELAFEGAVELRAKGGPLTLTSDQGVAIHGPALEIQTGKLHVFAGAMVQKVTSLYQRVRDALNVHAGKAHTTIDDASFTTAKNAFIVTEDTMTINGKQIHLG